MYLAKWKDVFWELMNLEKAYDTIDRHGMRQMLRVYGVGGKLMEAVHSFYVESRACVRVALSKLLKCEGGAGAEGAILPYVGDLQLISTLKIGADCCQLCQYKLTKPNQT